MGKKILVADDQHSILEVVKIILEEEGYEVKTVSEGSEVFNSAKEYLPDLILLDIWMPGLNGKSVTKHLKSQKETSNIPIVIISALSQIDKIAKDVGADDYLPKPFDINNLLKVVKKYTSSTVS